MPRLSATGSSGSRVAWRHARGPEAAASAAYSGVLRLPAIEERDFVGLGLAEHVQQKIFTNLVLRGHLQADGAIVESALPGSADGLTLAGDLDAVRETVFDLIGGLCRDAGDAADDAVSDTVGDTEVFPSDLEGLEELSAEERAELYDNLVFNRYLDTDGTVLWADFTEPGNAAAFWVNADVGAVAPAVWRRVREQAAGFASEPIALDTGIFADLRMPADDLGRLVESLRFNGYLDAEGGYVDKRALLGLRPDDLNLAPEFLRTARPSWTRSRRGSRRAEARPAW